MRSNDEPGHSPDLMDRLARSRARLILNRSVEGTAWAILAGLGAFAMLRIGAYLAPVWPWFESIPREAAGPFATAVLLASLVAVAVRVRTGRPDLLYMARHADRRFGLDERLATALEFGMGESRASASSPVLPHLFRDAAGCADRVNPKTLVPFTTPRAVRYIVPVAVVVLALDVAPPVSTAAVASVTTAPAWQAGAVEELADGMVETAALLRLEAERRENEYLKAVAAALERLALEVLERGSADDGVGEELARLVAHAEHALRTESSAPATDLAAMTTGEMSGTSFEDSGETSVAEAADGRDAEAGATSPFEARTTLREARAGMEEIRSRLDGEPETAERLADASSASQSGDLFDADGEPSNRAGLGSDGVDLDRPVADLQIDPQVTVEEGFGAGVNAQDGMGGGTLAGAPEREALPDATSSREFELPSEGGSRRQLPVEIVPATRFSEVQESPVRRGDWRQAAEEQVTSEQLGVSYREIASRYFLSLTREPSVDGP
jgi:hypothetical protein